MSAMMQRAERRGVRRRRAADDPVRPQHDALDPLVPASFVAITPVASSRYDSTASPASAAIGRSHSMWQPDSAATYASSGSTPAGSESGTRTTCGELDASTTAPPSKRHRCARLAVVGKAAAVAVPFDDCGVRAHRVCRP